MPLHPEAILFSTRTFSF